MSWAGLSSSCECSLSEGVWVNGGILPLEALQGGPRAKGGGAGKWAVGPLSTHPWGPRLPLRPSPLTTAGTPAAPAPHGLAHLFPGQLIGQGQFCSTLCR